MQVARWLAVRVGWRDWTYGWLMQHQRPQQEGCCSPTPYYLVEEDLLQQFPPLSVERGFAKMAAAARSLQVP